MQVVHVLRRTVLTVAGVMEHGTYTVGRIEFPHDGRHYVQVRNPGQRTRIQLLGCDGRLVRSGHTENQMSVYKARKTCLEAHLISLVLPFADIFIGDEERHVAGRICKGGVPLSTCNIVFGISEIAPEVHIAHVLVDTATVGMEYQGIDLFADLFRLEVSLLVVVSGKCVGHKGRSVYHTSGSIFGIASPDVFQSRPFNGCLGTCLSHGHITGKQSRNQYGRYLEYLVLHNNHLLRVTICTKSMMEPFHRYGG